MCQMCETTVKVELNLSELGLIQLALIIATEYEDVVGVKMNTVLPLVDKLNEIQITKLEEVLGISLVRK